MEKYINITGLNKVKFFIFIRKIMVEIIKIIIQ